MKPSRAWAALLPAVLLVGAAWVLHRELRDFHWHQVSTSLQALPGSHLALALLVTAANYALLSLYDVLALAYVERPLPYPRVAMTSFIAYAFGNNLGMAMLSSGSVRYRLYSSWGLGVGEVTRVAVFCGLTLWLGLLATGGGALLVSDAQVPGLSALPGATPRVLGALLLLLAGGYVLLCARRRQPLVIRGHAVALPSPRIALAQVLVSALDWLLASAVLFLLLPPGTGLSLPAFIALYMAGQLAGLASQVPGGLGVFDSVLVAALASRVPAPAVLGSLVVWRAVYYLLPFVLALGVLAGNELLRRREQVSRLVKGAHASFGPVVPLLAALGAVLAGAVLLFSGATPTVEARLAVLRRWLPLPLVELSHLLGSLAGVSLVLLGRGLQRRLDAAYGLTLGLLVGGGLLSLAKGIDFEEATLLFALALALAPFRAQFYRHTSLFAERFSAPWLLALAAVVGASVWLGFFSYRHVDYGGELWWRFTFEEGDAPRFLRASVGVGGLVLLFGVARLLSPSRPQPQPPDEAALARARPVVARSPESMSHLALVGDKTLLFNEAGTAFLMYGVSGRVWVALGDPVGGTPEEGTELAWRFLEAADAHHGQACFYQVGPQALPRYVDLGLALLKLGEEATVPLADFRLDTPERRGLRHAHRKMEKEGLGFEVVPREGVAALLPQLREISDAWLAEKNTREKGFSLGSFSERYLGEGPVAVVRQEGALVGFANLWAPECKAELSLDLMRYRPDAPRGVMDHLFVSLMLWGREQGYGRFNLGMAPFSGFESHSLAPPWQRLGSFLYAHGEHFYNFQGLRQFKEKFHPVWTPRYLATPGGLAFPRVLAGVGALVSRGLTGLVTR